MIGGEVLINKWKMDYILDKLEHINLIASNYYKVTVWASLISIDSLAQENSCAIKTATRTYITSIIFLTAWMWKSRHPNGEWKTFDQSSKPYLWIVVVLTEMQIKDSRTEMYLPESSEES